MTTESESPGKERCRWIIHLGQDALSPITGVGFDLVEAAGIAGFFEEDGHPFIAKAHVLGFVGNVIAPGHGA